MEENNIVRYDSSVIQRKILSIRDQQVILDSELAILYGVETRRLNEQVKRNKMRFPKEFMFQLSKEESANLISQNAISSSEHGGKRKLPKVFTEQGVAMLSAVLKSETAVKMSVQIINAFVSMRRFLVTNGGVFQRLEGLERRQIETDQKLDTVLDALQRKDIEPKQGIFFNGQVFDAYKFTNDIIRKAKNNIILIDNYIDDSVLDMLTKKKKNVSVTIYTKRITKTIKLDAEKFNEQYPSLEIKLFTNSHDRFLILDEKDVYHIGASLKDLGKKWFAFSKMEIAALSIIKNLKKVKVDE